MERLATESKEWKVLLFKKYGQPPLWFQNVWICDNSGDSHQNMAETTAVLQSRCRKNTQESPSRSDLLNIKHLNLLHGSRIQRSKTLFHYGSLNKWPTVAVEFHPPPPPPHLDPFLFPLRRCWPFANCAKWSSHAQNIRGSRNRRHLPSSSSDRNNAKIIPILDGFGNKCR